ncbi:protein-disulfide reductase DsbD family protein [Brevundimonas sp.]|uniref:protein-disulfide reductase DsbD family protein n=1 Tax=Brevundimonas sp. TaxID=1871086 RepID=UPI002AB9BCAA|nr:thioredoxin family protein [Brevundimonas sp.]MDZ4362019.1 protein-disulfide reductase DsbD family protein [Brevundimonas sp.]
MAKGSAVPFRPLLLLLFLLFGVSPAWAQPVLDGPRRTERIEAELVPLSQWVTPGSTAIVAVRQDIQPGWHTYWRNPGDSGGPTSLTWTLPQGVVAEDIVWHLPERQPLGDLVNFGYSGQVYLPVPIRIPAQARPGSTLVLTTRALFFVCSDQMCVPETLTLSLTLPVRAGAAPLDPRHGAAIQAVVEKAPRPAGIEARASLDGSILTLTATGGPLAGADLTSAIFFPFEAGVIDHAAEAPGERGPRGLTLRLTAGPDSRTAGRLTGPVAGVLATNVGAYEISAIPGAALPGASGQGALTAAATPSTGLAGFSQAALFALLGGLILNLMPCVFPILAMKAAALAATAHQPRAAARDGLAFLAGVLVTFLLLAGLLLVLRAGGEAIGWGFQLQSPAVTAALALLMLAVALNLSGVFHVGAGLQGAGSGPLAHLPGGIGAFFTGVLAVVVAAPCTAPFMALALGAALVMPWPMALAVFLMLGLGLALPYVAISLSPGLLRRLPRPGPWMERLKALLAFPMYGAALWLAWVVSRQSGGDALALLLGAGLTLALSLWLIGQAQGQRADGRRGTLHLIAGVVVLIVAGGLAVLAARVPPTTGESSSQTALASRPWSPQAVEAALAKGQPVLVNFTADWCVTCKINEASALSSPRTAGALEQANAVYLVADWTRRDDAITAELERRGRSGVPLYLLFTPGRTEPRVLPQLLSEGVVVEALAAP